MSRKFTIEIRDYTPGTEPDGLTTDLIESHLVTILDNEGSDGIVIVTEES